MRYQRLFEKRNLWFVWKHFPPTFFPQLLQHTLQNNSSNREQRKAYTILGFSLLLIFFMSGCQNPTNNTEELSPEDNITRLSTELTLNDAVLEQSNNEGNIVWKIKAQRTTYSDDRKIAYLEGIAANLIQDGKIILKVRGDKGEILEQGTIILLKEDVVATDARNQSILRGNVVEWRPLENVLQIKDNLQVNHPNLVLTANTAQYSTDTESLEVTGKVVANTREPKLILESDRAVWQIPQDTVNVDSALKIVRYQEDTISDRLLADKGQVDLKAKTVLLNSNVELTSLQPTLQIATNSAIWNYQQRLITSDRPIRVVDQQQQLTITGNQGQIDFQTEIATLKNGVKGDNKREKSTLYAKQAIWSIPQQEVVATGNVIYNKSNPQVNLTGDKAVIQLTKNKAVVTSDRPKNKPVVSVVSN